MMFKKLALASLISVAASGAYALEVMDEASLSETTGQAGVTIETSVNISGGALTYTDNDGFSGFAESGSLVITGLTATGDVTIDVDAGASAATTDAALRLRIQSPVLNTSFTGINVKKTSDAGAGTTILSGASISLNNLDLSVELGNGPLNHLAVLSGNLGTITINNLAITDSHAAGGGDIGMTSLSLSGLNVNGTTVDVHATNGLVLTMGAGMNAVSATMSGITLGTATAIGDVSITGLNMAGTSVSIRGH